MLWPSDASAGHAAMHAANCILSARISPYLNRPLAKRKHNRRGQMACFGACWQPAAVPTCSCSQNRQQPRGRNAAAPPRALQPGGEGAQPSGTALPPPPPAVGWLWDNKGSADTRRRLQEQNLRPKK